MGTHPRLVVRMIRSAGALAAIVLLIVGIPVGLHIAAGNPLTELRHGLALLTEPDNGTVFLTVVALIAWIAWALFALSVIAEVISQLAGIRVRLPGPQQRFAAMLVTAVLAGVLSPGLASANAAPVSAAGGRALAAVTVDQAARAGFADVGAARMTVVAYTTPAAQQVYVVQHGDYLGAIAERYCGHFDDYTKLQKLNPHRISDPSLIEPGWRIVLPTTAQDRGIRTHATGHLHATDTHAPTSGKGPGHTPPPGSTATPGPTTGSSAGPSDNPDPTPSTASSPTSVTTGGAAATPRSAPIPAPGASGAADPTTDVPSAASSDTVLVASGLAGAGLLAGLIVLVLARRRHRQQQHRRPNRRIATPPQRRPEVNVRAAAKSTDVDRLDLGLRMLAAGLHGRSASEMPDVAAAWLNGGDLALILTSPCPPPNEPWVALKPTTWSLPADVAFNIDPESHPSPLPVLGTLSSRADGANLLVDLERTGVLTVGGDVERGVDLIRYLAAEAATSTWGDDATVILAGFDTDDTANIIGLNEGRVRASSSIADAYARISRRAAANTAALLDSDAADALHGRINELGDAWSPQILFVVDLDGQHADALNALDEQLRDAPRTAVAIVAVTPSAATWHVDVDYTGSLSLAWLGTNDTDASQLSADQLAALTETVRAARPAPARTLDPVTLDGLDGAYNGFDEEVPPAGDLPPWADGTDAHGHLLGSLFDQDEDDGEDEDDEYEDDDDSTETTDVGALAVPGDGPTIEVRLAGEAVAANTTRQTVTAEANGLKHPLTDMATAPRRRLAPEDPELDDDLQAWKSSDKSRPHIAILGPVTVEAPGFVPDERVRFYSEILVFLAQRGTRGAALDDIMANLYVDEPIGENSLRVLLSRARLWAGEDHTGAAWMPANTGRAPYRLLPGYLMDWHLFRRLRARGEARGAAGAGDLRTALDLVRGVPLDGADRRYSNRSPYAWLPDSDIAPYHIVAGVVDTAHQLVDLCLAAGDTAGARWAVAQAWLADPDRLDDHPWQDLMRTAHSDGREAEMRATLADLMRHRAAEVPEDLSATTYKIVRDLQIEAMQDA